MTLAHPFIYSRTRHRLSIARSNWKSAQNWGHSGAPEHLHSTEYSCSLSFQVFCVCSLTTHSHTHSHTHTHIYTHMPPFLSICSLPLLPQGYFSCNSFTVKFPSNFKPVLITFIQTGASNFSFSTLLFSLPTLTIIWNLLALPSSRRAGSMPPLFTAEALTMSKTGANHYRNCHCRLSFVCLDPWHSTWEALLSIPFQASLLPWFRNFKMLTNHWGVC